MKQSSSMMLGVGLHRLQHAADAGAAGDVAVLADLGAGADRGPGVDHGAAVDTGADVDEGGHQDDVPGDDRRRGAPRAGHGAEARLLEAVGAPAGELERHLVHRGPAGASSGPAAITSLACRRKESSTAFFSHWRDHPVAVRSSPPRAARRNRGSVDGRLDGVRGPNALGRRRDAVAPFPGRIDRGFQIRRASSVGWPSLARSPSARAGAARQEGRQIVGADSVDEVRGRCRAVRPDQDGGHAEFGGRAQVARRSSKNHGRARARWRGG